MKRYALVVVVLYFVALCLVAFPLLWVAGAEIPLSAVQDVSWWVAIWTTAGVLALLQAGFLVVPIRLAGGRRLSTRWMIWSVMAAVLATLVLEAGLVLAIGKIWPRLSQFFHMPYEWMAIIFVPVLIIWAFLLGFFNITRPSNLVNRLSKVLRIEGIVGLLIAVPCNIFARDEWSAGNTVFGLIGSIALLLFSFGPATFFAILRQYSSLQLPEHLQDPSVGQATADTRKREL